MKGNNFLLMSAFFMFVILFAFSGSASAVGMWTWGPGDPNYNPGATIHPGVMNTSGMIFGDFLGLSPTQPNTSFGSSGVAVNWDDTWVGGVGDGNTNGDALDGLWAQIVLPNAGWWDLGTMTDTIAVFLSQDHGPYLAEGLEYRIYGSNTLWSGASTTMATVTDVYLDGWRPYDSSEDANGNGWQSDDIGAILDLQGSYRYVKLEGWLPTGALDEPEVDAIGVPVPEPGTLLLLGPGLIGLGVLRRKFRS